MANGLPAAFVLAVAAAADALNRPLRPDEARRIAAEHGLTVAALAAAGLHVEDVSAVGEARSLVELRDTLAALPGGAAAFESVTAQFLSQFDGPAQPSRLDS